MGARRNTILGLAAIVAFVASGLLANAQESQPVAGSPEIDYQGFSEMTDKVMAYREGRLVSLAAFNEMKSEPDTILLDTRSRLAYDMGHIDGAVHLDFSDFTDEKLADVIPSKGTRILIYCNNNFADDIEPVMLKRAPLALNIPTFINLYGYGYENIYELGEMVSAEDEAVNWVSTLQTP
ncbi:rhodanese-like domain-containing protein [Henriciella aquimarina]|uniref:rhodanese-like domain-containing protein n=1 Tax=Henriciella aquimarina TaxID=545261 RepID=UPI000A01CC8D|nr:rhodanese-like domain-containing protein [Henriciella aquimarina]